MTVVITNYMGEGLKRAVKAIKKNNSKLKRAYKFRAVIKKKSLYFYNCDGCGKQRSSRIYERALGKICQVCLKNKVPDNQPSLFNDNDEIASQVSDDELGEAMSEASKIGAGDIDEAGDAEGTDNDCPDHKDGHHFIPCDEWSATCSCGKTEDEV